MSYSVTTSDWLPDLMPRLPGADEDLILRETFAAVREFCEDGLAWVEIIGPLSSQANNPNMYLDPLPGNASVGYVLQVTFRGSGGTFGRELRPVTGIPPSIAPASDPAAFFMQDTGHLVLRPTPSKAHANAYEMSVSMIPSECGCQLPAVFRTHYRDAIIDGVCARMMLMHSKPWTNAGLATHHGKRFRNFIKRTRTQTKARYTSASLWRYPSFANQRYGGF